MVEFDVVVVGGGINGLAVGAYLAKCGLSVLILERRDEVGVHCSTEEVTLPGFLHNLHATAIMTGISPCMQDLDLSRFGLDLRCTEISLMHTFLDKKAVLWHSWDAKWTYDNWKRFSSKDAEVFKKLYNSLGSTLPELIMLSQFTPPSLEAEDKMNKIVSRCDVVPEDWWDMNGFELLDILYEDEHIKTALAGEASANGDAPWMRGVGSYGCLWSAFVGVGFPVMQPRGGSHMLPHALARCVLRHGGVILQNCPVEKIIVKDGEAKGVVLAEDAVYPEKTIYAKKAVVSDLTVVPTFLQLVGEEHLPHEHTAMIKRFNYNGQIIFGGHYAINEPPKWVSHEFDDAVSRAWCFNYGAESVEDYYKYFMQITSGRLPDPIVSVGGSFVCTLADPTQAPPGKHTALTWVDVPYDLRKHGGPDAWDSIKEDFLQKATGRMTEYAPNFKESIIASYAHTPLDIYRRNPSALKGSWSGGPVEPGQYYMDRPFPGCGAPRTPIRKLYICNSTWPYGQSWMPSGYIAACVLAEDLGVRNQSWWSHRPLEWYEEYVKSMGQQLRMRIE